MAEKERLEKWGMGLQVVFWIGLVSVLVLTLFGLFQARTGPLLLWGLFAALMILLLLSLGIPTSGHWYGVLIDSRNRTSLSRLQITLWTIMTLSAFLAVALPRHLEGGLSTLTDKQVADCRADIFKAEDVKNLDPDQAKLVEEKAEVHCKGKHPLRITFPAELVAALGISTASLAGSSLIKGSKKSRVTGKKYKTEKSREATLLEEDRNKKEKERNKLDMDREEAESRLNELETKIASETDAAKKAELEEQKNEAQRYKKTLDADFVEVTKALATSEMALKNAEDSVSKEGESAEGLLYVNDKPDDAKLGDLFQGDEVGNYNIIDLSKVQMFFFTAAVLVSYGVALYTLLQGSAWKNPLGVDFPEFSASLITLLGISHAGYLSVKSVDHTKTEET